ncbi:MAG TPA: hypothetical protein VNT01_03975 [Symbiobacteriaceae bacterium]|nr:hypothetical protein [Symbiobacteriaceae bacterium]
MHRKLLLPLLILLASFLPTAAHADVGSTLVSRLWDSTISTTQNRLRERQPQTVSLLQDAERFFLQGTRDVTTMVAVREVYKAMRVAGLLLLGLCTVISLSQMAESGLMGESSNLTEWVKRFCVAGFMTMGSIHWYGLWIRIFNALLDGFRGYLDTHWAGRNDPTQIYTDLIQAMGGMNALLILLFAVVFFLVLLILWFLIGGIRVAELAVAVMIAPLVWPLYLLPALEDIPKTAFRSFLGLNATLLIIVGMLRLAVQMEVGAGIGNTVWNFVPSLSMLFLTIFLPSMIKRIFGQGNTGTGFLTTAAYALAGIKGLSLAASKGTDKGPAVSPPEQSSMPEAPAGPSAYPVAPVQSSAGRTSMDEMWVTAPRQMHAGAMAATPALEAPYDPASGEEVVIDLGESDPGSNRFDTVKAVSAFMNGRRRIVRGPDPIEPETK